MSEPDAVLREFVNAPKPAWCIPSDVAVMSALIVLNSAEYPGHEAVGARCAIRDSKAVMRSLKRLEAAGWVIKFDGTYLIQAEKLRSLATAEVPPQQEV
jgi:hypothetical protein